MKKLILLSSVFIFITSTAFFCNRDGDGMCPKHDHNCHKDSTKTPVITPSPLF